MEVTNYRLHEMQPLSKILDGIKANPGPWRVRIVRGTPMYYYHNRYLKHIHANIRYKNGVETFRSKHVTDDMLDMPVARTSLDFEHKSATVCVFIPYGRKKHRDPKPPADAFIPAAPDEYMLIPDDVDDELPFN